jgi:hypothetical protein
MLIKQLIIVTISSLLLACAGSDTPSDEYYDAVSDGRGDCIFRSSIRGYSVLDESNLVIEGSGRSYYHVVLRRRARGIKSSSGIGFDSPSGRVCAGFSDVVFQDHLSNESIGILFMRELSPEDHNDLLIQFGKKEPEIEQTPAPRDVEGAEVEELDTAADDESSRN